LREIRFRDVDGVGDFFGVPGAAFGGGPARCPLASGPVRGDGEDGGVQAGQGAIGAGGPVPAVPAAGVRSDVGPDEAEDGGERDEPGVEPGGSGGAGGRGGGDVVDEEQRPGFLAGEFGGLAAQRAAGAADGPLQVKERDFDLPSLSIKDGDLPGRERLVVQQGGQNPQHGRLRPAAAGAGSDGEGDEPGGGVREPFRLRVPGVAAAPGAHAVRFVQHDQLRAVGQRPDRLERDGVRAVLDAPGQVRAAGGEPQEPVHGEEPAVGEIEHSRTEAVFQLVSEGVLAVVVAADRGAGPAEGGSADVGGDPQQRPGAVGGDAEFAVEHAVAGQFHRGAVDRGDLQALPQQADPGVRVRDGGVELGQPLHDLLAEQFPGLRERTARRDLRARHEPQAGQPGRRRQHAVVAGTGEQAGDQHADHGHLRGQHPVVLMARRRLPQRAGDHAAGEQFFQQARPAQLRQPLCPESGPGRDPGGDLRVPVVIPVRRGRSGRRRDDHGKLGRQQSSRWTARASTTQFLPGALFYFRDDRIPSHHRDQHAARP
jgi:hypothetical protein